MSARVSVCSLPQLVDQHIAGGANLALKAAPLAQQAGLAEGAAIVELGEMQIDAGGVLQVDWERIGVVGQRQHAWLVFDGMDVGVGNQGEGHGLGFQAATTGSAAGVTAWLGRAVLMRARLAAVLNGSCPMRCSVWMKGSPLSRRSR